MGQLIRLIAITYFVAEIVILFHLKCPPDVRSGGNRKANIKSLRTSVRFRGKSGHQDLTL